MSNPLRSFNEATYQHRLLDWPYVVPMVLAGLVAAVCEAARLARWWRSS